MLSPSVPSTGDAAAAPASFAVLDPLLRDLLAISLTAVNLLRPLYGPTGKLNDFTLEFLNPAAQRITGLPEQPGATLRGRFPETFTNGVFDLYRHAFETGEDGRLTLNYQADGLANYFQIAARRSGDLLVVSFTDTAGQPRAAVEVALREAETEAQRQRLHQLVAEAPTLIACLRGPGHHVELVNNGFRAIFGGRELVGKPYRQAVPELYGQPFFDMLDAVYRTGETSFGIEQLAYIDRQNTGQLEPLYFNYTFQATRDVQEQVDGIIIFATEVTEQVLGRQERESQRQQLACVFEQAPVAVALFQGPNYIIEVANARVAELWGRSLPQVLGRPLFDALPEVRDQGFRELLDQVVATGEAFVAREVSVVLERQGQLQTAYLNFVYQPLRDAAGHIGSVIAVAVEVTEQVEVRKQVQHLNTELAATNEKLRATNEKLGNTNQQLTRTNIDLDTFVYTASHDLRAPITNIEGLLETLRHELPSLSQTDDVAYILTLMEDSVQRFTHTINQLADVSKLQREDDQPAVVVHLAPVIEAVRLDLAPLLKQTNGRIDVDVRAMPVVTFPEKNLRSVVYNLVSNALKYHRPHQPPVVQVRSYRQGDFHVLEVQDNGLGLDLTRAEPLFKLFQRYHTHVEGTGVGLFMVKRMVENAGGRIEVESKPGHGARFSVYFQP